MQAAREVLPAGFRKELQRALGPEEALRRVWPAAVGSSLARNIRMKSFRGGTLTVSVPDRVWKGSLESLGGMVLEAINRFWGEPVARSVEFVVDARMQVSPTKSKTRKSGKAGSVPPVDLPAEKIRDEGLRRALLESAQKYFAGQQERRK